MKKDTTKAIQPEKSCKQRRARRSELRWAGVILSGLLAIAMIGSALAAPAGILDPTFGTDGILRIDFVPGFTERSNILAIQGDGKVVSAGTITPMIPDTGKSTDFMVVRFNMGPCAGGSDGCVDPTFSGDGWLTTDLNNGSFDEVSSVLWIDSPAVTGGKILVGGRSGYEMAMVRYCPDGSLDNGVNCSGGGFGVNGIAITNVASNYQEAITEMAEQPDGKIVVVGFLKPSHSVPNYDFMVGRYNANGTLDTTFATGGIFRHHLLAEDRFEAVAIQPDGKILAGGFYEDYDSWEDGVPQLVPSPTTDNANFIVMRLTPSGAIDTTFGDGTGYVTHHFGTGPATILSLAIQKDQKIIAGGYWQNPVERQHAMVRYCPNGQLDSGGATPNCGSAGFGVNGEVLTGSISYSDEIRTLRIQADGKIVAGGLSNPTGNSREFGVNRYLAENGAPDPSFGVDGLAFTRVTIGPDQAFGMVIDPRDGRIVLGGEAKDVVPTTFDVTLTRYLAHTEVNNQFAQPGDTLDFPGVGVSLRMDSGPSSGCSFSAAKHPVPAGGGPVEPQELPIHWNITSNCAPGAYSLTLTFSYSDVELLYGGDLVAEGELAAMRSPDGGVTWTNQGGVVDTNLNRVTVSGVTDLSTWWLASDTPSTTTLSHFDATPVTGTQVDLSWTTVWQGDLKQFDVYRSRSSSEHGDQINPAPILPQNSGGPGADYAFSDPAGLLGPSYYWLKITLTNDVVRWYGPAAARIDYPIASSFQAAVVNPQVNLSWNTTWEGELKQFDVFRSRSTGDHGSQVNPAAILPKNPTGGAGYTFTDPAGLPGQGYYWLRATLQNNSVIWVGPAGAQLDYPLATDFQAAASGAQVNLSWNTLWEGDLKQFDVFRSRSSGDHGSQVNPAAILPKNPTGSASYTFTDPSALPGGSYYWLRATRLDNSVVWIGPDGVSVAYDMAINFSASAVQETVLVAWTTIWEGDIQRFDVYRSQSSGDYGSQINPAAILPKNPTGGATYGFTDQNTQVGSSYYSLKITLKDNSVIWVGPSAVVMIESQMFFPVVIR